MKYKNLTIKQKSFYDIDLDKCVKIPFESQRTFMDEFITRRTDGEFSGTAFVLHDKYEWVIGKDSDGVLVLVPQRKD